MDWFVPTVEEIRVVLALRTLTYDQRQALIETIFSLAAKHPQDQKVARLAAIIEFKRPA